MSAINLGASARPCDNNPSKRITQAHRLSSGGDITRECLTSPSLDKPELKVRGSRQLRGSSA